MVPSGALSFLLSVSPLMMCSAWPMVGSLDRSAASLRMRGGRPNDARNSDFTCVSGNCKARVPAGYPANAAGEPVTCDIASRITSAARRRTMCFE
jgi:hypothetical protein